MHKLGSLQEKIIEHMVECPLESENTNHIGKALGLSQPAVFKSIQSLEKDNFILTKQEIHRGKRTLTLTDKGAAAALFSGNEKDNIYSYLQRHAPSSNILLLMSILKDLNDLDSEWIKSFIESMLYQKQRINESGEKIMKELIAALIVGPKNDYVDASKLRRILGAEEKLWLIEALRNKVKYTNSIVNQLMSEEPNETTSKPGIISIQNLFETPGKSKQLELEEPSKVKSIFKIKLRQPKSANTNALKAILDKLYSTSTEMQKDTTNKQVYYVRWNELSKSLNVFMPSDQVKLQVNKADKEMTITPIIKASEE
ncbi:MAG TPA: LysR family transcriptional regulator [Nitrososphaeraceae archaeon]